MACLSSVLDGEKKKCIYLLNCCGHDRIFKSCTSKKLNSLQGFLEYGSLSGKNSIISSAFICRNDIFDFYYVKN